MTTNPLVEYLASYGPHASANNLYDEFVAKESKRPKCKPIHIPQPTIDTVIKELSQKSSRSVILTGTAGDGKTYTARRVLEKISNGKKIWTTTEKVLKFNYKGKTITFVKDLSELNDCDKKDIFPKIRDSLIEEGEDIFVICVNDGHLLKFFREKRKLRHGKKLHDKIYEILKKGTANNSEKKFQLINMSRIDHGDCLDEIIDQIVGHESWKKCDGCSAFKNTKNPCPIRTNLKLLKDSGDPSIRARLHDMLSMASADGKHLPIRQIMLLIVNIILGDRKDSRRSNLLNCNTARRRANNSEYALTNPYANIFGDNLSRRKRLQYGAFSVLNEFGVGYETNNFFDQRLFRKSEDLPDHPIYGEKIFNTHRSSYRDNEDDSAKEFKGAIIDQRRRLFFSVKADYGETRSEPRSNPWNLTTFKYGAAHCCVSKSYESVSDPAHVDEISHKIILGLNRMMSGYLTHTDDSLWIIEPGGVYHGREIPLAFEKATLEQEEEITFCFKKPQEKGLAPNIVVYMDNKRTSEKLPLRPSLTECLIRIADGTLLSTFSSEVRNEVERFQLRMTAHLGRSTDSRFVPHLLEMENGALVMKVIPVISKRRKQS